MLWWRGKSTWGRNGYYSFDEAREPALRSYCKLMYKLEAIAMGLSGVLIAIICALTLTQLLNGNFENIIFYDGTERLCVMEGADGIIQHRGLISTR